MSDDSHSTPIEFRAARIRELEQFQSQVLVAVKSVCGADHPVVKVVEALAECPASPDELLDMCDQYRKQLHSARTAVMASEEKRAAERQALKFIQDLAEEELPHARVGTGAEVALRHIARRARETLAK
jgi:hypothetical protein